MHKAHLIDNNELKIHNLETRRKNNNKNKAYR